MRNFFSKLTVATWLTLLRIVLIPFVILFYVGAEQFGPGFFSYYGRIIALVLFIIAAVTDWVDGYIARKYNQVTDVGKVLDQIADKMLTLSGLVLVAFDPILNNGFYKVLPIWLGVLVLVINIGRDYFVGAIRQMSAASGKVIAADKLGKAKTMLQFSAIILLMLYAIYDRQVLFSYNELLDRLHRYLSVTALVASTILSVVSCVNYTRGFLEKDPDSAKTSAESSCETPDQEQPAPAKE